MPDHDLDAGWLLHGLGLAYAWAGDALPEEERDALRRQAAPPGQAALRLRRRVRGRLVVQLVLAEPQLDLLRRAGHRRLRAGRRLLRDQGLDRAGQGELPRGASGCCPRTARTARASSTGATASRGSSATSTCSRRPRASTCSRRATTCARPSGTACYQAAPDLERIIDHGDCHDRRSGHSVALYYKLASKYRIGEAQWLADQVSERFFWREAYESGVKPGVRPEAYQELLWFDPTVVPQRPASRCR